MKRIDQKILSQLKKINGNVLLIGVEEKTFLEALASNSYAKECMVMSPAQKKDTSCDLVPIRQMRRHFTKKSTDFVLCNDTVLKADQWSFVSNGLYLCDQDVYIYQIKSEERLDTLKKYYHKYQVPYEIITQGKENLLIAHQKDISFPFIRYFWWTCMDRMEHILDGIGDYLIGS